MIRVLIFNVKKVEKNESTLFGLTWNYDNCLVNKFYHPTVSLRPGKALENQEGKASISPIPTVNNQLP
jgi:hypothetical protein